MTMGFKDNPRNILGANTADNLFSSTNVAANADGSMIERQEFIQDQIAALASGEVLLKGEVDAAVSSTTVIPIAGLAGYGDDFFNTRFYMQVLHNDNNAGAAPEAEVRQITDYVSATGTFTCTAFSAAVQASDLVLILHESQVMIGRDDANNTAATTNVAANADGSVLERLEAVKDQVGDPVGADISADIAAVKAETADIAAIKAVTDVIPDAGALTSLAGEVTAVKAVTDAIPDAGALTTLAGEVTAVKAVTDVIPDAGALTTLAGEVTAIKAVTDVIPDAGALTTIDGKIDTIDGIVDDIKAGGGIGSGIVRKTVTFSNTNADVNLFTVTGTIIARLVAVCTTNVESAAGCNIGVDAGSTVIIADTDSTTLEAGDIWHDATPDASVEAATVMKEYIVANGTTILLDVETAKQVDSGVIEFYLIWTALSSDGAVAAAA